MWISQAAAARHEQVKVSKQRINELVHQGRLKTNDRKQVLLSEVLAFFTAGRDPGWTESPLAAGAGTDTPGAADPDEPGAGGEFREAKTLQARIHAETMQFQLDVKRGQYLPKQEVLDAMVASGRKVRQQLDAIPGWADELAAAAAAGGAQAVRRLLKERVRGFEQSLADAISLRADDGQENESDLPAH